MILARLPLSVIGHAADWPVCSPSRRCGLACFLAEPPLHIGSDIGGNAFGLFAAGTAEQIVGTAAKQTQPFGDTLPCRHQNIAVTKRIKVAAAIFHHRSLRQGSRLRDDSRQAAAIGHRLSVIPRVGLFARQAATIGHRLSVIGHRSSVIPRADLFARRAAAAYWRRHWRQCVWPFRRRDH